MLLTSSKFVVFVCVVFPALGRPAPMPMPMCNDGVVHLGDGNYYQNQSYGMPCTFIGADYTNIIGGLAGFQLTLRGQINFNGGVVRSEQHMSITGKWVSFHGSSIKCPNGCSINGGDVGFFSSNISIRSGHTLAVTNSTLSFGLESKTPANNILVGKAIFSSSSVGFTNPVDADFLHFKESAVTFSGKTARVYSTRLTRLALVLESSNVSFAIGENAITGAGPDVSVSVVRHSTLSFMTCPSLEGAIHGAGTKGNLSVAPDSQVYCHSWVPLPKCNYGQPMQLEAMTYFQVEEDWDCMTLLGKPGTIIADGLNFNGLMYITGPMHFERGIVSAGQWAQFSGPDISFANCTASFSLKPDFVNASVVASNSTVSFGDSHTFSVMNSNVTFVDSSVVSSGQGLADFSSSSVRFVNSSIEHVTYSSFGNSTIRFEGVGSGIHGTDYNYLVNVMLVNTSMMFEHGDDAITEDAQPGTHGYGTVSVTVTSNSLLTFHGCTSLARAVHGNGTLGNVTTDSGSQALCIHTHPRQFFI